jgi:hypothetical protein
MTRSLALVLVIGSLPALAGNKVIQNDTFTGVGSVNAGISFNEYQGVGVMFEPPLAEYPLTVVGVDIFCVPYMNQGNGVGSYLVDLYDETSMTPAPRPDDAGVWPDFVMTNGRLGQTGAALTASTTTFNRFTFPQPITIASGRIFIQVTQQNSTTGSGGRAANGSTRRRDGWPARGPTRDADTQLEWTRAQLDEELAHVGPNGSARFRRQ